ncbi:hypothetical protein COOONC_07660 [Cooperia oncophora]
MACEDLSRAPPRNIWLQSKGGVGTLGRPRYTGLENNDRNGDQTAVSQTFVRNLNQERSSSATSTSSTVFPIKAPLTATRPAFFKNTVQRRLPPNDSSSEFVPKIAEAVPREELHRVLYSTKDSPIQNEGEKGSMRMLNPTPGTKPFRLRHISRRKPQIPISELESKYSNA